MKVFSGKTYIGYIAKIGEGYLPHIDFCDECSGLGDFDDVKGAYALCKTTEEAAKAILKEAKAIAKSYRQVPKLGKLRIQP